MVHSKIMKIITIVTFLFFIKAISAQDSIQIINHYDDTYPNKIKDIYWVKNSDSTIKVGLYIAYFKSGKTWISGQYNDGKREGIWILNDIHSWEPYLKFDYDNNKEIFYKSTLSENEGEYYTFLKDSTIILSKRPYCPDFLPNSFEGFTKYVLDNIRRKKILDLTPQYCKMYIEITINESGLVTSGILYNNCNTVITEEIKTIIETSPNWIPAESRGNKISYKIVLPLTLRKNAP